VVVSTPSEDSPGPRRNYDNRRRRADAEARQRRIVEAATALFIEQGFGPTSIDQIATTADVSSPTIYSTYGSKAGVLAAAIDTALFGDDDEIPLPEQAPTLAGISAGQGAARFAAYAKFHRALNDRVAPLARVMEQAASSDPSIMEMRSRLSTAFRADCNDWIKQIGPKALRPRLSAAHAADVLGTLISPYVYSLLTVDGVLTPDDYERWLAHALPQLLLKPDLIGT
jgi:AcrR family transcriptional regulator